MNYPEMELCCEKFEILLDWIRMRSHTLDEAIQMAVGINICPYCGSKRFSTKEKK